MLLPKLTSFITTAREQKYSAIIATFVSVAVVFTVVWVSFFSNDELPQSNRVFSQPLAVQITEKPMIKPQAETPPPPSPENLKRSTPSHTVTKTEALPQQPKPPEKQVVIGQGKLYVQVGAFKEASRAGLTVKKMNTRYKRAKIVTRAGLHLVWVGPVATKAEAKSLKKHIQRRDKIKGFITSEK